MKMRRSHSVTRTCSTIMLLVVMILQVGVKSFHLHHHAEANHAVCLDCEHHRVHNSHLLIWDGGSPDCLVCHLFSTSYDKGVDLVLPDMATPAPAYCICRFEVIPKRVQMHIIPRAPPAFLL
ncbi:MAG: hypothetical protein KBT12_00765 [Bacteroidales bacterium]|nr:hypothetical protein [Candidatus Physcousia equi]